MKAQDPKTNGWFFIDKCLPFGASISCVIFQEILDALKFLIEHKTDTHGTITNYLDDFLLLALTIWLCNWLISEFLKLCEELGIPIALEKTEWVKDWVIFLGILLDGRQMIMSIPIEKRTKAVKMLQNMLHRKKATVKELQELCEYLNFLCKAIFPGRPFLRCMYSKYSNVIKLPSHVGGKHKETEKARILRELNLKPHHHIRLDSEFKNDCQTWLSFLDCENQPQLANVVN